MITKYSPLQRWYKDIIESPENLFSKKNSKRILSSLPRISKYAISHTIKPLDVNFLNWFTSQYSTVIGNKKNAVVHDIHKATLGNTKTESVYQCLTLYENNIAIGGTIFGVREEKIMTAFKVYPYKWKVGTLQANPTLYTEYLLSKYGHELGKKFISHGKDRNPYGLNAAIGLATFKLSTGYRPYILEESNDYKETDIDTDTITEDALILHFPTTDELITEATLVIARENIEKYRQLCSYPNILQINTIYLN